MECCASTHSTQRDARLQQHTRPVRVVGYPAEVGERALRRAHLALDLAQLVRHGYQELAIALALVRRQRQDAGQIVSLLRQLLLGEVPAMQESTASCTCICHICHFPHYHAPHCLGHAGFERQDYTWKASTIILVVSAVNQAIPEASIIKQA